MNTRKIGPLLSRRGEAEDRAHRTRRGGGAGPQFVGQPLPRTPGEGLNSGPFSRHVNGQGLAQAIRIARSGPAPFDT